MNERQAIDRGWYYVVEPEAGRWAPADQRIVADDGTVLTRRLHGHPGRIEVVDESGASLAPASLLRASGAVGRAFEARGWEDAEAVVVLGPAGTPPVCTHAEDGRVQLTLDGPALAAEPSHHPLEARVRALLDPVPRAPTRTLAPDPAGLPTRPVPRAMFFESLMNTDLPHNDKEISQGVLHLLSPLKDLETEVVLVNAKMPITGEMRPVHGLSNLDAALAGGPVQLIGITLLEGYWEGVLKLIQRIRDAGCRAHIAVGGVMPSLAPEHVAAHLPEVSFVCRGAGEVFVPALARLVGDGDIDTPWTDAQRHGLTRLAGVIAWERAGPGLRLLTGRSDRMSQVDSLDRVSLDLSHVQARHVEGGIEITTSRGCIHRCSFCSILGRESYQARSAGSVFDVLSAYEDRFAALFGEAVPPNSYRVHISDDDFACERDRTMAFFQRLKDTPFRLSSVQVAVGDLCRRENGRLLAEPDHALLDTITPDCFADHGLPVPRSVYFEDHRSRDWSSFLQIGVETYDDPEIARLGKGYKRVHIRTIVAELARRGLHMDGYFILSNADTQPEDLVAVFEEVCRLKLRFPEHFHLRFPVVQHLVSYFTAATHRRHVRRGRRDLMVVRHEERAAGHPELDYPFIDHDEPRDPWVRETVSHTFVRDDRMYTGNLDWLRDHWRTRWEALADDDPYRLRIGALIRRMDDAPRRLVLDALRHASRAHDPAWPGPPPAVDDVLETATRTLGPPESWLGVLRATAAETGSIPVVVTPGAPADAVAAWVGSSTRPVTVHAAAAWEGDLTHDGHLPDGVRLVRDGSGPAVFEVSPAHLDRLPASLAGCRVPGDVALRPVGAWSADDAKRLAHTLHRAWPAGLTLVDDPGAHRHGDPLAIDDAGAIGPASLLQEGRLPAHGVLAHAAALTHLERHAMDRHDPTRWRGVSPAQHRTRTAAALQVLTSWRQHLARRRSQQAVPA